MTMRKLFSTLLFAIVALFFSSCGEKVYYASDFGIVPDTGEDMTKAIARAIETIKNECGGRPAVLLFEGRTKNLHFTQFRL